MAPLTSTVIVTHNLLIVYMIDESEFLSCSMNLEAGIIFVIFEISSSFGQIQEIILEIENSVPG